MTITKRNKFYKEIKNNSDYLDYLKTEIYNDIESLDNIIVYLPNITNTKIPHSNFNKQVRKSLFSHFPKCGSNRSLDYYHLRGIKTSTAKEIISKLNTISSPRCIEYYINKGYSLDESRALLKKSQTKVSLDNLINKYGEELGKEKWEAICKSKGRAGTKNSMYGKPAPQGQGGGICGNRKSVVEGKKFVGYCEYGGAWVLL